MLLLRAILLVVIVIKADYDDLALKKCDPSEEWSIHGWWPEYNKSSWPQFCNSSRFKEFNGEAIANIRAGLDKYWFSCGGDDLEFWRHEWDKHGTCVNLTVEEYVNFVVNDILKLTAF